LDRPEEAQMTHVVIKTGTEDEFFARGRQLARSADRGERLPEQRILSFEDPEDLMKLLTAARLNLFRAVKEAPGSITDIAVRLHRDRSADKRDIDELAKAGLVTLEDKPFPGHGRRKEVRVVAERFSLHADIA